MCGVGDWSRPLLPANIYGHDHGLDVGWTDVDVVIVMYNFTVVEVGDVVVDVDCDGSTTLTFIASNGQTNVFITESVVYLRRTPFQAWIKK